MLKHSACYSPSPVDSYEKECAKRPERKPERKQEKKILQVPVRIASGEKQELVVVTSTVSPPSPPIFRIVDVDTHVVITHMKLIPIEKCERDKCDFTYKEKEKEESGWHLGKVIINGFVDKNINYKTITDYTPTDVNGPLYQFTTHAPFSTFIEVKSKEPLCKCDEPEVLRAYVEGEEELLLDPNPVPEDAPCWAVTYNSLLEKILVKIEIKIKRIEEFAVQAEC